MAAAAWIAIGAGVALLLGIAWSVALESQAGGLEPAPVDATGDLHTMQVVPGMCLATVPEDGAVDSVRVVDCDAPHRGEAITAVGFSELRFPGTDAVAERVLDHCSTRMPDLGESAGWVAWVPSESSWQRGDRTGLCVATFDSDREGRVGPDRSDDAPDADETADDNQAA